MNQEIEYAEMLEIPVSTVNVVRKKRRKKQENPVNAAPQTDVVGPVISRYTTNLYIKNQILYVHLSSSVLREELMMGRDMLVRNLNQQVGAQVIVNIIFR